jgi:hypothetical protein
MNKLTKLKTGLVIMLCLFSFKSYASPAKGELDVEMSVGFSFTALENFNDNFVNIFNYGFLDGYAAPVDAEAIPGILQGDIKVRYAVAANVPVYVRFGLTRLVDTETLHDDSTDIDIATSIVSFNMAYVGVGVKYGFKVTPVFTVFIGVDGGGYIPLDSYWEVTGNEEASPLVNTNVIDPLYNASQSIDFTNTYLGGNVGTGIEWAISRTFGIMIEGGYKIAKSPVDYKKTGIFARTTFDLTELDFSGPYATGGIVLYSN